MLATFSRLLEPRREVIAERRKAKEERHLNQFIIEAHEQFDFSLSMLASRLKVVARAFWTHATRRGENQSLLSQPHVISVRIDAS